MRKISLVSAPRNVVGYHGCTVEAAERILETATYEVSTNTFDWLGRGVYFWEYAPYRALEWATRRCRRLGGTPAVLRANIRLGRCLNLLDVRHTPALVDTYKAFVATLGEQPIPENTILGANYLDRAVIDAYCRLVEETTTEAFQTVRGCFPEGQPIYVGSRLLRSTHVQIAVRDQGNITRIQRVEF